MADLHTAGDSAVQSKGLDHQQAVGIESSSQAMSKPGESATAGGQTNAEKIDKLINTGVLPDMLILDDKDRPESGKNSMSSKDTQKHADDIVKLIGAPGDRDENHKSVADALNKSVKEGANLTELVQDVDKAMQDSRFPTMPHAYLKTNDAGQESLTIKTGPFGGTQYKVENNIVDSHAQTNR